MEDQHSEEVVIPDMSEPLTNKSESIENLSSDDHQRTLSVTTVDAVPVSSAVPVSLPVGSLINVSSGTTFNVITQEQLQLTSSGQFKPILCVDNSCICDTRQEKESDPLRTWSIPRRNKKSIASRSLILHSSFALLQTSTINMVLQVHYINKTFHTNGLKTTHIVIQDGPDDSSTSSTPNCSSSWTEYASMPVLPIRCKNTSAELHKNRFGSGGRGRCVKLANSWYTPSEFEALCGRASSKDWKRSIRFGGRSLQTLIDEGILTPHATSCTCAACCDDESATGPVRLFTPYKRRKRKDTSDGESHSGGSIKLKRLECRDGNDSNGEDSCDSNQDLKDNWTAGQYVSESGLVAEEVSTGSPTSTPCATGSSVTVTSPIATTAPSVVTRTHSDLQDVEYGTLTNNTPTAEIFRKLDEMTNRLLKSAYFIRRQLKEAKEQWNLEKEQLQVQLKREKDQAVLAARVEAQVACSRVFDSAVHVVDNMGTVGLQPTADSTDNKKCANCNRDAFAECSLCRHTPYCSTFCQRKDWGNHQVECVHSGGDQGSIMLIVESTSEPVLNQQE